MRNKYDCYKKLQSWRIKQLDVIFPSSSGAASQSLRSGFSSAAVALKYVTSGFGHVSNCDKEKRNMSFGFSGGGSPTGASSQQCCLNWDGSETFPEVGQSSFSHNGESALRQKDRSRL